VISRSHFLSYGCYIYISVSTFVAHIIVTNSHKMSSATDNFTAGTLLVSRTQQLISVHIIHSLDMGGACSTYGGKERCVQDLGMET
jgi:hypothetical protein